MLKNMHKESAPPTLEKERRRLLSRHVSREARTCGISACSPTEPPCPDRHLRRNALRECTARLWLGSGGAQTRVSRTEGQAENS